MSIFLSLHAILSCQYATLVAPNGFTQNRGIWYLEGFERIEDTNNFRHVCTPYPAVIQMNKGWRFSRIFSLASGLTGSAATSFLWSSFVTPLDRTTWFHIAGSCVTSALFQALLFPFIYSNGCRNSDWVLQSAMRHCTLSIGFDTNIAATILWLVTAAFMITKPPPKEKKSKKQNWEEKIFESETKNGHVKEDTKEGFPVKEVIQINRSPPGGSVASCSSKGDLSEISQGIV